MSGHSKWANIKRKKGANDAIRAKMTTKLVVKSLLLFVWVVLTLLVICVLN